MYEQYTDEEIVEMLIPKMNKCSERTKWDGLIEKPWGNADLFKVLATIYRSAYIRGQLGRSFIIGEKKADEKKVKEPVNTFKVGDKVKFLGLNIEDEEVLNNRLFYPPVNTVGKVVELGSDYCFIQWPDGATADNGVWACRNSYLEKVTEHWVPGTEDNVNVGSKVRFVNECLHKKYPQYFPCKNTIGEVKTAFGGYNSGICDIQWPKGTTSKIDLWFAKFEDLEVLLCE